MNTNFTKVLFSMVTFYLLCLYRSPSHIVATIAQLKKTRSSFLILWGKMALLMLRYMLYKYNIVYFSLYSSVHCISCLTLRIVPSFVFKNWTSYWWKKQEMKKKAQRNNTRATNEKRERERERENRSSDTLRFNIPHKTHT